MRQLKVVGLTAMAVFIAVTLFAQEMGIKWTPTAYHITTNDTYTIVGDARLVELNLGVVDAGTNWQIQVATAEATPKILYTYLTADGTGQFNKLTLPVGIYMHGGITIVSSGDTPGEANVFMTRRGGIDATPTPTATYTPTPTATYTPTPTPTSP